MKYIRITEIYDGHTYVRTVFYAEKHEVEQKDQKSYMYIIGKS